MDIHLKKTFLVASSAKRFQRLMDAVSVRISKVDSDHEIADELGTSTEFVRRHRKFITPRPPVLIEQLKRGIFCPEFRSAVGEVDRLTAVNPLGVRAETPNASPTAAKVDSDHQIAAELNTSTEFVRRHRKFIASRPPVLIEQMNFGVQI